MLMIGRCAWVVIVVCLVIVVRQVFSVCCWAGGLGSNRLVIGSMHTRFSSVIAGILKVLRSDPAHFVTRLCRLEHTW